jgi:hypothetical protein
MCECVFFAAVEGFRSSFISAVGVSAAHLVDAVVDDRVHRKQLEKRHRRESAHERMSAGTEVLAKPAWLGATWQLAYWLTVIGLCVLGRSFVFWWIVIPFCVNDGPLVVGVLGRWKGCRIVRSG